MVAKALLEQRPSASLRRKTSSLRINDLLGEGSKDNKTEAAGIKNHNATSGDQGKGKKIVAEAGGDEGYLSDDPDESLDPEAIVGIAAQAGFAITLLVPFEWHKEVPRTINTVMELLLLWGEHMTANVRTRTGMLSLHGVVSVEDRGSIPAIGDFLCPTAASLKLTSVTKAIMEDLAMVFTSTSNVREEWPCVQEGCGKAHGTSFAQAADHAASVRHCTEKLKAGSATRQSKGKLNLMAVRKDFEM
ncbi:unnamed protein product [Closterium sp. NIES-54]